MRRLLVATTAVLALTPLAACGDDDSSSDTSAAAAVTTVAPDDAVTGPVIVIQDFSFDVPDEVPAGTTITVRNEDSTTHTVTADDGSFDVEVEGGTTATFTSPSAGSYPFHCEIHSSMKGELQVA
jgi:plastocyanin